MIWMASCGPWAQTSGGKRSNSAIMKSEDLSGQRVCAGLFDKVNKMIFSLNIGLIQFAEPIVCMSV